MLVCICNAIRERDVRQAVAGGATTPCAVFDTLGRSPKCGQCAGFARSLIRDSMGASDNTQIL